MTSTLNKSRRGTEKRRNRGRIRNRAFKKGFPLGSEPTFSHTPPLHVIRRCTNIPSNAPKHRLIRSTGTPFLTASHCRRSVRPEAPHLTTPRLLAASHFDVVSVSLLGSVENQIRTQRRLSVRCHWIKVKPLHIKGVR